MKISMALKVLMTATLVVALSGCATYGTQNAALKNLRYQMSEKQQEYLYNLEEPTKVIHYRVGGESGAAFIRGNSIRIY